MKQRYASIAAASLAALVVGVGQSNAPDTQSPGASPSGSATGSGSVSTDTNTQTPSASPRLGDDKVKPDDKDRERMKDQEKIDRKTGR